MVLWTVTTIGFVLCIAFVGGTMVHFLRGALDSEEAKRIDPLINDTEEE